MLTLKQRSQHLRLSARFIAAAAGIDEDTVARVLDDGSFRRKSQRLVEKVIATEEARLAAHLFSLPHVDLAAGAPSSRPGGESGAAAAPFQTSPGSERGGRANLEGQFRKGAA
jgi:hypothetical protein